MKLVIQTLLFLIFLPVIGITQNFSTGFDLSDSTQVHILETRRGDVFIGKVTAISGTKISFLTGDKLELEFDFSSVKQVSVDGEWQVDDNQSVPDKKYSDFYNSELDSFPTQIMLYTPTAFSLKQGKRLYTNVDILWNSIDFALTDNLSLGVGTFLPIVANIRGKFSGSLFNKIHLGAGFNHYSVIYDFDDVEMISHVLGIVTFGTPELFVNFTAGYILPIGDLANRMITSSVGVGHETKRFIYKAELFVLRERDWQGVNYISVYPELAFVFKNYNRRWEAGVFRFPWIDFPLIPYLGFKIHF